MNEFMFRQPAKNTANRWEQQNLHFSVSRWIIFNGIVDYSKCIIDV
jgi:hypothetical protein